MFVHQELEVRVETLREITLVKAQLFLSPSMREMNSLIPMKPSRISDRMHFSIMFQKGQKTSKRLDQPGEEAKVVLKEMMIHLKWKSSPTKIKLFTPQKKMALRSRPFLKMSS